MSPISKCQGLSLFLGVTGFLFGACNPYERRVGEYSAGAVDPVKFPRAYLGNADANRPWLGDPGAGNRPGQGSFNYVIAWVNGKPVSYYPLPFIGSQATGNLDLMSLKPPRGYVFDAPDGDAVADTDKCQKPEGYMFDKQTDAVRFDRQGNIFVSLPVEPDPPMTTSRTTYKPIINMVPVTSMKNDCQGSKSEANVVTRADVSLPLMPPPEGVVDGKPTGIPIGRYMAYAIIDPAAAVNPPTDCPPETLYPGAAKLCRLDEITGLGPQRWGWYQQYLLAYLDGGTIPLEVVQPMGKLLMKAQNLYFPELIYDNTEKMDVEADLGMGFDIMDRKRGEDGYSPICHVFSFVPVDTKNPEKSVNDIDMMQVTDTKKYVYCLQTP